ncbi:rhodanese-like domain-containing protein, partial [Enterococcus lactis]
MSLLFQPIKSITVPELKEKLLEKSVLLDVRTPAEYRGGHIKGAK